MTSLFDNVNFELMGEDYSITPTMKLIKKLWDKASLLKVRHSLIVGDPHVPDICLIIAEALTQSGYKITADEIFIYFNKSIENQEEIYTALGKIYFGIFPKNDEKEAPEEKKSTK